ncbi:MAG: TolB-like protein/Tfp pilus assembly protein PilF [Lysobacterales bacterium]|jgi:TolB-like protein/Tfp pilus assembly protein PilF
MSFFEELKRRNVFRVGIAYAVTVWILIQALSIFMPMFEAPEWVMKVISIVLLAGFPVVLIIAWAYELTPDGIKRDEDVDHSKSIAPNTGKKLNSMIIGLMAIAIVFLLFDKFTGSDPFSEETAQQSAKSLEEKRALIPEISSPETNEQSIAVLPFDNRSTSAEDEFFVEGIHDDLLTNLARIGSLKVISRTSVAKYKNTEMSIPDIARELGVANVMEGAVQRAGNTVRINVQLIDAQTDEHLWAEIFDREMSTENLFAIQSEISGKIAEALKATLSPAEQNRINKRPTENLAAYNAYMRGRQQMAFRSSEGVDKAAAEFRRAVELDPEFALAWANIAHVAGFQATYSDLDMLESVRIRRDASERALALDDELGEAHLARAQLLFFEDLMPQAEASYLRAIELSPNNATAYQWYANFLNQYAQRRNEALQHARHAVELDPMSALMLTNVADVLEGLGRYEEAEQELNHVLELDPGFAPAYSVMADLMSNTGRMDETVMWIQKSMEIDPGRLILNSHLLWAYMDLGDTEAMLEVREKMAAISPDHLFTGFVDMVHAMYTGNLKASMESAQWVNQRLGRQPWFQRILGYLSNMERDFDKARQYFEVSNAGYFVRESWRESLEGDPETGCMVGWILLKTGDVALGNDLLNMTEAYIVDELPSYIDHADRYSVDSCYIARGRLDEALDAFETQISHRHYTRQFFLRLHPQYEPFWGNPRFEAAMQQMEDDLAKQRENLAQQKLEAGP